MKKFTVLSLSALFALPSLSIANEDLALEQEILSGTSSTSTTLSQDLNKELDKATSGFGRFRFGGAFGLGYYSSSANKGTPRLSGFAGEFSMSTMFNPIRDWADVELGVRALYVHPSDSKSKDKETNREIERSYSGLISGGVYAGMVFRYPEASSAIAMGVYKDLATKSRFSSKQRSETDFKENLKYKPGQGVYLEYQYIKKDSLGNVIMPFARINYGTLKSEYRTETGTQANNEKLFGIVFGIRY